MTSWSANIDFTSVEQASSLFAFVYCWVLVWDSFDDSSYYFSGAYGLEAVLF